MQTFHEWLKTREVPDVTTLAVDRPIPAARQFAMISARSSAFLPKPWKNFLAVLVAAGQVVVVSIGGERRYRAVG